MGELLLYNYKPGQILMYEQVQSMILTDPERGRASGRSVMRSTQKVLDTEADGTWIIELNQEVVSQEGALQNELQRELVRQPVLFRMNSRGALLDPSGDAGAGGSFPSHPVEEGDSWTPEGDKLGVIFRVRAIEKKEDEVIMHLVSTMAVDNPDDGSRTTSESSFSFSITGGFQLDSTSVLETTWKDGRALQVVIENKIKGTDSFFLLEKKSLSP
jgi:hypothetical protein